MLNVFKSIIFWIRHIVYSRSEYGSFCLISAESCTCSVRLSQLTRFRQKPQTVVTFSISLLESLFKRSTDHTIFERLDRDEWKDINEPEVLLTSTHVAASPLRRGMNYCVHLGVGFTSQWSCRRWLPATTAELLDPGGNKSQMWAGVRGVFLGQCEKERWCLNIL